MKWTVIAIIMILLISTSPLVQSRATEQQIQGQIQEPRGQSPAGAISQVLMVVGSNVLFVLNVLYTTCFGLLSALYTSVCAPLMAFVALVLNAAYTTVCAPAMGLLAFLVNAIYTTICAPVMAFVAFALNALYTSCCAPVMGIVGGLGGSLVGILAACVNALYTTCFGCVDLAVGGILGGIGSITGVICGGIGSITGVICGGIGSCLGVVDFCVAVIVGIIDFIWAGIWALVTPIYALAGGCIAGLDIFNIPLVQALSYILSLFFWALSTFFGICSICGIPCCGYCGIGPALFASSTCLGILASMGLEILYFAQRCLSTLPVI
jgi:phage-related protein